MPKKPTGVVKRTFRQKDGTTKERWYARVRMPDGREVWKACHTYQDAVELASELKKKAGRMRVGLPVAPEGSRVLFREVVKDFLKWSIANKRSWQRDKYSLQHLEKFFGDYPLTEITAKDVEKYRAKRLTETTHYGKPPSNPTLNREVRCLTRLLRWAVDRGLLPNSPLSRISLPKENPPRMPSVDLKTEALIIENLPSWARLPIMFALHTGARAGEILQAKWRDIDLETGQWVIPDSKNLSPRVVPLNEHITSMLLSLKGLPDSYVFTLNGKPISVHTLSDAFKRTVKKIGRPDLRLHDLRHVFASRLLAQGASLPEIAALLVHKTLSISARYSHASPERLRALVSKLPKAEPMETGKVISLQTTSKDVQRCPQMKRG